MLEFDFELDEKNLQDKIRQVCIEVKPHWSGLDEKITIKILSGGITNSLYACHLSTDHWNGSDTVLFRIYGLNTEDFISRSDEVKTMILMKKIDLGPQIFGKFKNGICYELLSGEIVTQDDVYNESIYSKIAESVAKMQFSMFDGFRTSNNSETQENFLFSKLDKFYSLLEDDYKANMSDMTDDALKLIPSKIELKQEVEFLKNYFMEYTTKMKSLIVFSHNDLLLGNIIYNKEKDLIKFIDYEYGQMNYQAYDIANHFNEYAGVDNPDYSYFPGKEFQLKWLKTYLIAFYEKANEFFANNNQEDKKVTVDDDLVEQFYDEVNKFTAASNLLWSIWSLIQAQSSTIDFNFVNYAQIRYQRYREDKKRLV